MVQVEQLSHLREQKANKKEFHISVNEIIKARESGIYSSGDDDMIAMELAVEKYLIKFGHLYETRKQKHRN